MGSLIYIFTNIVIGSFFITSSPTFVICGFFDVSHSHRSEVITHCDFDLHSSDDKDVEHFFSIVGFYMFSLGKMSVEVFCPFLIFV